MDNHRKRGYDDRNDYSSSKRHAGYTSSGPVSRNSSTSQSLNSSHSEMMFKVLCPPQAVGCIIGKSGTVLQQLKEMTGARIRVSLTTEFYPGTNERVIATFGPEPNVSHALSEISNRIIENIDQHDAAPIHESGTRDYEIRCLIPTNASGAIIGRGGSVIKHIGEKSNCRLDLDDYYDVFNTQERVLHIKGTSGQRIAIAIVAVFEQLRTDQSNRVYVNQSTSYELPPGVHGAPGPAGTPYGAPALMSSHGSYAPPPTSYGQSSSRSQHAPSSYAPSQPAHSGYNQPPNYGSHSSAPTPAVQHAQPPTPQPAGAASGLPPGCTAPMFSTDGTKIILQMGIPDEYLGVVIGKQGGVIRDIMTATGAHCQVTPKGEYLPGTMLRQLKITGSQPQVQSALNNVLLRLHNASARPLPA